MTTTKLSVNLNKLCLLRNARGGHQPDVKRFALHTLEAGADGLTIHPRPDARHATAADAVMLRDVLDGYHAQHQTHRELNIEGNPFAAPRAGYPGLLDIVKSCRPEQVTLVPDADGQLTSDHGFDPEQDDMQALADIVAAYRPHCRRVSVFVDPGTQHLSAFQTIGIERIELYTGPYAERFAAHRADNSGTHGLASQWMDDYQNTAQRAQEAGLAINAGHDLDQHNLAFFLGVVKGVAEVSIGHALTVEALQAGWSQTVRAYADLCHTDQ